MSTEKKKVLLLADWFAPGYKAGGPIRSCVNFARHLKDDLDIYVLTTDRDLNESSPYKGIPQDKWIQWEENIKVFYASPHWLSYSNIKKEITALNPAFVYINSMYSRYFSLYPLMMKRGGKVQSKFILSPRGMLRESAIRFKKTKKIIFLKLFRLMGLHKQVLFHCTDAMEVDDVRKYFGAVPSILLSNLPKFQETLLLPAGKKEHELKILFVGRIHPIKNLHFLIDSLRPLQSNAELTIIATLEDQDYWQKCAELISQLPANIKIHFKGEVANEEINDIMVTQDIFALPTQGENFGHAIFEALCAGRPVVISDQTPWRGLAGWKAGWDLPLDQARFTKAFSQFSSMNQEELNEWCVGAWQFAHNYIEHSDLKRRYIEVFSQH